MRIKTIILDLSAGAGALHAQQPDTPPGQAKGAPPKYQAYLFSHMIEGDYGRLYYSVSLDGLHWKRLNGGKRVFEEYHGHSAISLGHDGRYYLVGNRGDDARDINFWVSSDLIKWTKYGDFTPDLKKTPDYPHPLQRIGAPKLFYDHLTEQYLLTWHTPSLEGTPEDPERYWASQRTLYVHVPKISRPSPILRGGCSLGERGPSM